MKAAVIHGFGPPEVLTIEEIPRPAVPAGHVRIRVLAAGINRLDHYVRNGDYLTDDQLTAPHVLGADASGVIDEVGEGVATFKVGERVIPMPGYPDEVTEGPLTHATGFGIGGVTRPGTYAEFVTVPSRWVLKDDTRLPPAEAATLPMVVTTAVRAVKIVGEVKAGQTVLVLAGASGTGSMAIQVAKALGARVLATVRKGSKAEFVSSVGADRVIVSEEEDFVEVARAETGGEGVDVVIDALGGDALNRGLATLRRGGVLVSIGFVAGREARIDVVPFFFEEKQIRGSLMGEIEDLRWGLDQVEAGRIRPLLDRVYPLEMAAEAHRRVAESSMKGNVVLVPGSDES